MKISSLSFAVGLALMSASTFATVTLDGHHLTQEQAWAIANGESVEIAPEAMKLVTDSFELMMTAARQGAEIYGLTVGVGLNKDHQLFDARGELTDTAKAASVAFNRNILRSHSVGYAPMLDPKIVRLSMVIRLNTLLNGRTGVQPYVAQLYRDFLNKDITPVVPSRGSIGDADITLASHIGSAMMGEWKVVVNGKEMSTAEALKAQNIKPLVPFGKDGLGILSTNSVGMAMTLDALKSLHQVIKVTPVVFGLTLEGMNGNVAPFLAQTVNSHPLTGLREAASEFRNTLKGSYLWDKNASRPLQDPLSFRTTVYTYSEILRATKELDELVSIQLNSSDDNPGVIVNASQDDVEHSQVSQYFVKGDKLQGAIIPSANFEPLPIAISAQRAAIALAHVAHNSVQRTMRMDDERFSGLARYLTAKSNANGHNFGATEDAMVSIYAENLDLANPVSFDGSPVEGTIEDTASNLPRIAERLKRASDNMIDLYSMELLHSTQAVDLRREKTPIRLSTATQRLYDAYRAKVKFVDQDRIFTGDLAQGVELLKNW
ncbi:MAG: aromatic amino acid ammonia-lyase [Sutterella sp.]|nr:aromatic amino acid ammonia-lyase [Sutterella sp.]